MTNSIDTSGAPRRTEAFAQTTVAGAQAALEPTPAGKNPEADVMDEKTARTLGGRLLAAGGVLLAGSLLLLEVGARAAGVETGMNPAAAWGLMSMMAGMTTATVGAALRFPDFFAQRYGMGTQQANTES
ncbi:MAG: hypothetical protein AAF658_02845 [Myxococcota bacterium]